MLNFRTVSILFLIACAFFTTLHYSTDISWWWLVCVILIYLVCIAVGSANIRSGFYTVAYCKGNSSEKKIAITFDDGPTSFTKDILQTLSAYSTPATFFMIGKNIQGNEEIVKQVLSQGHIIGNHTFSHSFFIDFKNTVAFKRELQQTDDLLNKITDKRLKLLRPPYGVTTPHLARAAKELDYKVIGWNIRSLDTTKDSEEVILNRITGQIKPGSIILFHDTSDKTNRILKKTLEFVRENKYQVVSLELLLNVKSYR